ncbi:DUF934 domain-containing protein [Pseudomonas anguilliseptica]|uniref:Uncharacterized conserved protein, DUF934 family n=1 Tax=Pseudomonas anguilliseptica TaxID=53406 RepID=A0A1H5G8D7_PSEAG|nr:DUF934 domain-containing protein [Pseudomonas anguilliseptica]SEE11784.1 Uncharacterized conserved protein, DUF934 family [Pseudomonas anguilliseptica]
MNNLIRLIDGVPSIVENDPWCLLADNLAAHSATPLILPLSTWFERQDESVLRGERFSLEGVCLAPDDDVESLQTHLPIVPLIAIDFPSFRDGRGYSQAYLLRTRLSWQGELRAVGDVLRDQLSHMRQCGFDAFAVRKDKSVEEALKGLAGMSVLYGRSAIEPRPLFRRRAEGSQG